MRLFMGWTLAGLDAGAECVLRWEKGAVPTVPALVLCAWGGITEGVYSHE